MRGCTTLPHYLATDLCGFRLRSPALGGFVFPILASVPIASGDTVIEIFDKDFLDNSKFICIFAAETPIINKYLNIMTLQQLEYIVAVDKYRHFVRAAESCGVTQSTLSSLIRKLEDELDIVIFDRNAHPVVPTMAGQQVLDQAKVVLFNSKQLMEMSLTERKKAEGDIRLGLTPTIVPYILPEMFAYLNAHYPDVHIYAQELHRDTIIEKLKKAELDVAIMSFVNKEENLLEIPLYHEQFVAYVSPQDPLYEQSEICSQDMPADRLWALKQEISFQQQIPYFCNQEIKHSSFFESGCTSVLVRIVDSNGGFTVLPKLHIGLLRESMQRNIRPLVNPVPTRDVALFVRKDYVREGMLNILAEAVKAIIPEEMLDERLLKYKIRL